MEGAEFGGMRTAHSPIVVFGVILFGVLSSCSYSSSKMLTDDEVAVLFLRQKYYSRFLFVVGAGDTTLRSFSIDNTTGSLTPAGIVSPSVAGIGIDIHPTLPYVYQTLNGSDGIEAFRFDQTNAALTSVGVVTTGNNNSHRVRVLADGNSLFFNSVQCGNTCVWRLPLSAGLPGTQAQVNNTIPNNSQWMDVDPRGRFLYSANNGGGFGINMFQINGSSALISKAALLSMEANNLLRAFSTLTAPHCMHWCKIRESSLTPSTRQQVYSACSRATPSQDFPFSCTQREHSCMHSTQEAGL